MGLLGDIFGSQERHADTSTTVNYPDWWLKLYKPVLQDLNSVYRQQNAQPINPLQQLGYQGLTSAAIGNLGQTAGAQNYLQQLIGQQPQGQTGNTPTLQSILGSFDWTSAFPSAAQSTAPPPGAAAPAPVAAPRAAVGVPQAIAPPAVGRPAENIQQLSPDQARLRALAALNSMGNNPPPIGAFPYLGGR
jgi:hypothetical protein